MSTCFCNFGLFAKLNSEIAFCTCRGWRLLITCMRFIVNRPETMTAAEINHHFPGDCSADCNFSQLCQKRGLTPQSVSRQNRCDVRPPNVTASALSQWTIWKRTCKISCFPLFAPYRCILGAAGLRGMHKWNYKNDCYIPERKSKSAIMLKHNLWVLIASCAALYCKQDLKSFKNFTGTNVTN